MILDHSNRVELYKVLIKSKLVLEMESLLMIFFQSLYIYGSINNRLSKLEIVTLTKETT